MEAFDRNRGVVEDFAERTLSAITTDYGRLLYVATLRDLGSGAYSHSGLESLYPMAAVQEALTASHEAVFERILEMPLSRQLQDLKACLMAYDEGVGDLAGRWKDLEFYRSLVPLGLSEETKELFCSNLEALLSIIESEGVTAGQAA